MKMEFISAHSVSHAVSVGIFLESPFDGMEFDICCATAF
jgi:hypothetical protein